jgi:hypothetical protein
MVEACQKNAEEMLGEDRAHAALFMERMATQYPATAMAFAHCAKLLKSAAACGTQIRQLRGDNLGDAHTRKQLAALVRQAAAHEREACAVLKEILNNF